MPRTRPLWIRGLRLRDAFPLGERWPGDGAGVPTPQARSRFRSLAEPTRFAEYSVRDAAGEGRLPAASPLVAEDHTLVVVREFRRVPLDASGLGLMLFSARPGHAARLIATLAHWVERALSVYHPSYLLLARSLEQPRISVLLAGVHEGRALQGAHPGAFSVEPLLSELAPLLDGEPERYAYCPEETDSAPSHTVSPHAV